MLLVQQYAISVAAEVPACEEFTSLTWMETDLREQELKWNITFIEKLKTAASLKETAHDLTLDMTLHFYLLDEPHLVASSEPLRCKSELSNCMFVL